MKSFYFMLGFLCFATAVKFEKCGSKTQILDIRKFSVSPEPILLSGKSITATFDAKLHEDIPSGARVHFKAWKVKNIFGFEFELPVPCLISLGCNADHCKFFDLFERQECPFLINGTNCGCPIIAQTFTGDSLVIPVPEISGAAKWFASGKFRIEIKITKANSEQLTCYSFIVETRA